MLTEKTFILPPLQLIGSCLLLFLSFLLFPHSIAAQTPDPWVRFCDSSSLCGYKDPQGNIKVPAMYSQFISSPDTFHNIIPVSEKTKQYYLLKNGKKVGLDSVYIFDWNYDCEREGKILFEDHKLDRVGFLDKNGLPIIPAIYNYAYPFRNGLSVVRYGASRKCMDEVVDTANCEHYGWAGGVKLLINEKNEILIDSLDLGYTNINWYSLKMNTPNLDTNLYFTVIGRNGITYSFVDYNKEFTQWFYHVFIPSLRQEGNVRDHLFDEVSTWIEGKGWVDMDKNVFLDLFPSALTSQRFQTNELKKISNGDTGFNQFIFDTPIFRKFYNACDYDEDRFPVYHVIVNYNKWRQPPPTPDKEGNVKSLYVTDYQESFEFLRTENGYRLISATFRE